MRFFQLYDIFFVPVCLLVLYMFLNNRAKKNKDPKIRKLYYQAFYFKLFCVLAFALISEFLFEGGDTNMYYQGIKDIRTAITDDFGMISSVFTSEKLDEGNPLTPYFYYDNYSDDITYNYMISPANFFIPRLGIFPSLVFMNSYLCICLCFAFFALGGAIRIFKLFHHYYPKLRKELAIAILFMPSVGFWSAGLLKDTICFGCVGYILYGIFSIVIKREKYISSAFWIITSGYMVYVIKPYIFLVLLLSATVWIFAETNKLIRDRTLRKVFAFLTFVIGITAGFLLLQYFTSQETLRQYQFENILSSAEFQRRNYQLIDQASHGGSSYYSVNTSNPILLIINSIVATFFRPFPWEISSAVAFLSAIESMAFLLLTGRIFFQKGLIRPFQLIFQDSRALLCFVFAIVFAIGIGASTANFGALSRYKIPCMPFYLIMIILLYKHSGLAYPKWFTKILGLIK